MPNVELESQSIFYIEKNSLYLEVSKHVIEIKNMSVFAVYPIWKVLQPIVRSKRILKFNILTNTNHNPLKKSGSGYVVDAAMCFT